MTERRMGCVLDVSFYTALEDLVMVDHVWSMVDHV